ncbi:MBL fold metallo-hydrolase [Longibacter salinarum]|uniref:MBL fold metallo-hydrolase n=1 Tax=Longibacter salinarum TaxID=1850348 RepID=A0A2A8CTN9_9BACT|nr:MBL fold metallo-hydrolase [Longibacter salinarum]PEN11262.1 MBL fold metallo-hydrolase [Longibacter salinarum]
MPDELTVTLLGTGTSTGVPVIGCDCEVCQSDDPRDTRTRCACYIDAGDVTLLVDTGPDFRAQMLREDLRRIDAVLYTHHHFDHIAGLDDLRPFFFWNRRPMPCYGHPLTVETLAEKYDYVFGTDPYPGAADLSLCSVEDTFRVPTRQPALPRGMSPDDLPRGDEVVAVDPILLYHGDMPVYGYRVGDFAYLTDVNEIPSASLEKLEDLDTLVLDALRPNPHPTHFSFDQAVDVARRIGARQTYFIHMTHNVLHAEQEARLPENIHLGYDGLQIQVNNRSD